MFDSLVAEVKALDVRLTEGAASKARFDQLGLLGDDEPVPTGIRGKVFDTNAEQAIVAAVKTRGGSQVAGPAIFGATPTLDARFVFALY